MPLELARVRVERHHAGGVQIRAFAFARITGRGIKIRRRVSHAPIDQIEPRIERARHPSGPAAELPAVALPRLVALLARPGNGVEAPSHAPGFHRNRSEIAAMRRITAR